MAARASVDSAAPAANLHLAWAELLLRAFVAAGVRHLVLSPGSRSTPLALAAAEIDELTVHVVVDERQAGFVALGQARVTRQPSVVVCTSGTAAGHYLPSLLEAREAGVPVVVLTADRPWEAQHVASAQTTDQTKLFGDAVRGFFGLSCPEPNPLAHAALARTAVQAVALARGPRPGGVHVNAPFRKPLEPVPGEALARLACTPPLHLDTVCSLHESSRAALRTITAGKRRVLLVAGPAPLQDRALVHAALDRLRQRSHCVVLAESTSGLRASGCVLHADALTEALADPRWAPDLIVALGLPPVSTPLQNWLSRTQVPRIVIAEQIWADPWSNAHAIVPLSIERGLSELVELVEEGDRAWAERVQGLDAELDAAQTAMPRGELGEANLARLVAHVGGSARVMIGNSLPVRDLDVFGGAHALEVLHQRGVAGIDGLLAGAAGSASVSDQPVVAYLGDVSFLHDVGALALLANVRRPLPVVVVNNDGGRIFQELPLGTQPALGGVVERHFVTPHGHDLSAIARGFGVESLRAHDAATFEGALRDALRRPRATVIEAVVQPNQGHEERRAWRLRARECVQAALSRSV